jgi:ribose transport system substrate-binding protein
MNTRRLTSGILAATCLLALVACRSSGSGDTAASTPTTGVTPSLAGSTEQTPSQILAAAATEPTSIPSTLTKLPKAPEKGLKVAFLTCSNPSCALLNPGFTDAAKLLGWKPTVITYDSAQPGQALQQAINAGYKYIATTSITLNTVTPQIAEAKAKGIAIFGAYTGDKPEGKTNGLYGVSADFGSSSETGKLLASWTIKDSNSAANTVFVSLPIYPTLVAQGNAAKAEYASACPKCSFAVLGLSATQVGQGQTPAAIVNYLKTHTSTNYVYLAFGGLDAGVSAAIKAAGLASRVKIIGGQGQKAQMQQVISGAESAWSILPEEYTMWVVVDWMARLNIGALDQTALDATSSSPSYLVDTADGARKRLAVDDGIWQGPTGFQSQFKALWGL